MTVKFFLFLSKNVLIFYFSGVNWPKDEYGNLSISQIQLIQVMSTPYAKGERIMKKRIIAYAVMMVLLLGAFAEAHAATEIRMTGDARVHATYSSHRHFSNQQYSSWGWLYGRPIGATGRKEEKFAIWQRFRLRTDFVANEALKFRLGIRVNHAAWGDPGGALGAYDVNNAQIQVYLAYLQFKWPDTDIEFTIGKQSMAMPHTKIFNSSPIQETAETAGIVIDIPIQDKTVGLKIGYSRFLDLDPVWNNSYGYNDVTGTRNRSDDVDMFFLNVPIQIEGFKAAPWAMMAIVGKDAFSHLNSGLPSLNISTNQYRYPSYPALASAGRMYSQTWRNITGANPVGPASTLFWWLGSSFEVTYFDPFRFYVDVMWGYSGGSNKSFTRSGWFVDAALEYTGFDSVTPQIGGWWSSGEDGSTKNGSERIPHFASSWGPGNTYLFDNSQELASGPYTMGLDPVGTWGLFVSLKDITFLQGLTHRLTFAIVNGTNSPSNMRHWNRNSLWGDANFTGGPDYYYMFGRDLSAVDWVYSVNFDTKYQIYENLAAVLETGWAHGDFSRSVWTNQYVSRAKVSDSWKVSVGLTYRF